MRPAVINPRQGMVILGGSETFGGFSIGPLHIEYFNFWMWRVRDFLIEVDIDVTTHAGIFSGPIVDSRVFQPGGFSDLDYTDQILSRIGVFIDNSPNTPRYHGTFSRFAGHVSGFPQDEGYFLFTEFNLYDEQYTTNFVPNSGMVLTSVVLEVTGTDPITGRTTQNFLPFYARSSGNPTLSGTVKISPAGWYPWKDDMGVALFDSTTGELA